MLESVIDTRALEKNMADDGRNRDAQQRWSVAEIEAQTVRRDQ